MPAFTEVQRYARHPLFGPLVLIALAGAWAALLAVAGTSGLGFASPLQGALVWLGLAGATAAAVLFAVARLETTVEPDGLRTRFAPLQPHGRFVPWRRLTTFAAVSYSPVRDYGGWGVRGWGQTMAYNARGSEGVLLLTADGRSLLVGSQRALELERAIAAASGRAPAARTATLATARKGRLAS